MNSESPGWQPVDPSGASLSAASLPEAPRPGEVVVFASVAAEDQQEWAARTVAEIVREWADSVDRLLLMDLDLQGPGIHHALDADPAEGASDVLLFGASLSRVSQSLDDGAFHFAPSGTPVADPRVILSNSGWNRILRGLEETGVSLVLHLPLRQSGAPSILDRADRILQLGGSAEGEQGIRAEYEGRVVARLTPPELPTGPVVDIGTLAPDPVPGVTDVETGTPAPEEAGAMPGESEEGAVPGESEETAVPGEADGVDQAGEVPAVDETAEAARAESVVDIRSLAPDRVPGEREEELEGAVAAMPEEALEAPVVDIADLAPDEPFTATGKETLEEAASGFEEAVESAVEEAAAEARARTPEEAPAESPEPDLDETRVEAVEGGVREIAGPVVEIADLAPDEPVDVAPSSSEEVAPGESRGASFQDDAFAAGLDAIDAAAEAGKPKGYEGFDLEGLDELAESAGGPEEEVDEGTDTGDLEGFGERGSPDVEVEEPKEYGVGDELETESGVPEAEGAVEMEPGPTDAEEIWDAGPAEDLAEAGFEPEEDDAGDRAFGGQEEWTSDVEEDVPPDVEMEEPMEFGPEEPSEAGAEEVPDPGREAPDWSAGADEDVFTAGEESRTEGDEAFIPDEEAFAADEEGFAADEEESGFGEFSGEVDLVEAETGDEDPEGFGASGEEPGADQPFEPGPFEEGVGAGAAGGEDDLASDLVTGPDFGQGAPESDEIWEDDDGAGGPSASQPAREDAAQATREPAGPEAASRSREGAAEALPGGTEAGEPRLVGAEEVSGRDRSPRSGRPLRLLIIAVLLAVGAVAAHWYGAVDVPGLDRALGAILGPAGTGAAPTVDTGGPQPASPVQSRSLVIDVYRDGQSAGDVALALRDRLPDRIFAVAPVQQGGDVIFRLLAGPANSPEEATALRQTLAQVLTREDPSQWAPQGTSLAFLIDELSDLQAANARARAATGGQVFAYVLPVSYPDGSTAYRVYAGGYSSAEEARALQGFLSQAGLGQATFTERRGEVPE